MEKSIGDIRLKVPQGFEATKVIGLEDYRVDVKKVITDAMHYILHQLRIDGTNKMRQEVLEKDGYIPLNAQVLREVLGHRYNAALRLLLKYGVIETDNYFSQKEGKSRGYRLTCRYLKPTCEVQLVSVTVKRKMEAYLKKKKQKQSASISNIKFLTKWLSPEHLSINVREAHNYIESYRNCMMKQLMSSRFKHRWQQQEARYRIYYRTEYMKAVVKDIHEGNIRITRDDAGRLYTPITALKKELRNFVLLDGKNLVCIDVSASQPYLFQLLMQREFWRTQKKIPYSLHEHNRKLFQELAGLGIVRKVLETLNHYIASVGDCNYQQAFQLVNWQDDFYSHMASLTEKETNDVKKHFSSRGATKLTVMMLLYDEYSQKAPPYFTWFVKVFPFEVAVMNIIREKNRSRLPVLLQSIEAALILEDVCKRISEVSDRIPLLTIHDSVITTSDTAKIVYDAMQQVLTYNVGATPGLKEEVMSVQNAFDNLDKVVQKDWAKLVSDVNIIKQQSLKLISEQMWPVSHIEEVPLIYEFPVVDGKPLLSTRYVNPNFEELD